MIRPWRRSRLFWFGLLGLFFLLWGWADWSPSHTLTAKVGHSRLTIGNHACTLKITRQSIFTGTPGFTISGRTGTRAPDHIVLFPASLERSEVPLVYPSFASGRLKVVAIAYWFLLLIYLPLWLGAITAWQRRKARLVKSSNPA